MGMGIKRESRIKVIYNQKAGQSRGYLPILKNFKWSSLRKVFIPRASVKKVVSKIKRRCDIYGVKECDIYFTKNRNSTIKEVKKAVQEKYDMIICVGGDGTVNQVLNGLYGSILTLVIIPTGSVNAIALSMNIPFQIDKALDLIFKDHKIKEIDVGRANGVLFGLCAGIGFDADIVKEVENYFWKKKINLFFYILTVFKSLLYYNFPRIYFKIDGKKEKYGYMGVLSNMPYYAGEFQLNESISCNDGFLNLTIFEKEGSWNFYKYCISLLTQDLSSDNSISQYKIKNIEISSDENCFYHLDGEVIGNLPLKVSVLAKAIRIYVPLDNPPVI